MASTQLHAKPWFRVLLLAIGGVITFVGMHLYKGWNSDILQVPRKQLLLEVAVGSLGITISLLGIFGSAWKTPYFHDPLKSVLIWVITGILVKYNTPEYTPLVLDFAPAVLFLVVYSLIKRKRGKDRLNSPEPRR
jgi:hypothetical protein